MKTWPQKLLRFFLLVIFVNYACGNTVSLSMNNLDQVLKSAQVVFVAFCADWCPFSRRLKPIWEEAATKWAQEKPGTSVVWAVVDSVQQADVADKYFVNKYPTMKLFINGELINKEYRSTRSVDALTQFVDEQLKTAIVEFSSNDALHAQMDRDKRNVLGYIANKNGPEYNNFQKIAALLREDCVFWSGTDEALKALNGNMLIFKDPGTGDDQTYTGSFTDYDYMKQWLTDKCIPLVREVTFENVEELTEEGLPFLIFFRDPKDKEGDKIFTELVVRELYDQKSSVNALLADGHKFAHPLKHLGKTAKDLPILAIDSFQHMFLFPNMSELDQPGKLRQFVLDLHSGKLHKEFHETLDQKIAELQKMALEQAQEEQKLGGATSGEAKPPAALPPVDTTPKPSIFKELKPSNKRYSLLKTEL
uniref:Thioredoxin domain-containing protein n=1 Tax=Panagrolaimus sp. JU765 TaxID=591449 RepID=A0AC34Q5G9_9BILA